MKKIITIFFVSCFAYFGISIGQAEENFGFGAAIVEENISMSEIVAINDMDVPCNAVELYVERTYPLVLDYNGVENTSDQIFFDENSDKPLTQTLKCNAIEIFTERK